MANVYADDIKDISGDFLYLVRITLDRCNNVFSQSPCTATGTPICHYSFFTCRDKENYVKTTRIYKFQSKAADLISDIDDILPYLVNDNAINTTTEIRPRQSLTVDSRLILLFDDDKDPGAIDHDKGSPFFNTDVDGTFWRNLLQRNPNFVGRKIELLEGKPNYLESEFQLKYTGFIENIEFVNGGKVRLTAHDLMKKYKEITIPNPVSSTNILTAAVNDSTTTIPVTDGTEFKILPGGHKSHIKIIDETNGDEYLELTTITNNDLTVVRTALFGTSSSAHAIGLNAIQVAPFLDDADTGVPATDVGMDPVDAMVKVSIGWVGYAAAEFDQTQFEAERDLLVNDEIVNFILEEPTKAEELMNRFRRQLSADVWQNEAFKITMKILAPPVPGQTLATITDAENIIMDSGSVDMQSEERKTRVLVYYNPVTTFGLKFHSEPEDFIDLLLFIDGDAESVNGQDEERPLIIFADQIVRKSDARKLAGRFLRRFSPAPPLFTFNAHRKDSEVETGDLFDLTTEKFVDNFGAPEQRRFQMVKKTESRKGKLGFKAIFTGFRRRYVFIGPNTMNDWLSRTDANFNDGYPWISDAAGVMSDGQPGSFIF